MSTSPNSDLVLEGQNDHKNENPCGIFSIELGVFKTPNILFPDFTKHRLTVFDWDDTLLCSSYIEQNGWNNTREHISNEQKESLQRLEEIVCKCLDKALFYSDVVIITNSDHGWVEISSNIFMPKVWNLISNKKISTISAKTLYQSVLPYERWKYETMNIAINNFVSKNPGEHTKHFISFGDTVNDRNAARNAGFNHNNILTKTVVFSGRANPKILHSQLAMIEREMDRLYEHNGHLDLQIVLSPIKEM